MVWLMSAGALLSYKSTPSRVSHVVVLSLTVRVTELPCRVSVAVPVAASITICDQRPSASGVILVLACLLCPATVIVAWALKLPSFFHEDFITPRASSFTSRENEASSSKPARLAGGPVGGLAAVSGRLRLNTSGSVCLPCFHSPAISMLAAFILPA